MSTYLLDISSNVKNNQNDPMALKTLKLFRFRSTKHIEKEIVIGTPTGKKVTE